MNRNDVFVAAFIASKCIWFHISISLLELIAISNRARARRWSKKTRKSYLSLTFRVGNVNSPEIQASYLFSSGAHGFRFYIANEEIEKLFIDLTCIVLNGITYLSFKYCLPQTEFCSKCSIQLYSRSISCRRRMKERERISIWKRYGATVVRDSSSEVIFFLLLFFHFEYAWNCQLLLFCFASIATETTNIDQQENTEKSRLHSWNVNSFTVNWIRMNFIIWN